MVAHEKRNSAQLFCAVPTRNDLALSSLIFSAQPTQKLEYPPPPFTERKICATIKNTITKRSVSSHDHRRMHPAAGQLPPFSGNPIPREDIRRVVDLARFSPSWKNTQPVRYIVIDDPALKERMARECIPGQGFNTKTINRAAALAVIAYVPGLSGQGDAPLTESQAAGWEMFDAGIAAQTFCLAARDLGIGTCILGIFDAGAAGRLLELEGLRPACLIAMGYPEQWKNGPGRKETEELLSFR